MTRPMPCHMHFTVFSQSKLPGGKYLFNSFICKKIDDLNGSLLKISHQLHNAYSKVTLKTKVDALQKGMADTGAEITKLSDDMEQIEKQTSSQSSAIKRINSGLWNISVSYHFIQVVNYINFRYVCNWFWF